MREALAERLLAKVMQWSPADVARGDALFCKLSHPTSMTSISNSHPGMHFIESLAIWLNAFSDADRQTAYEFVKDKLIFVSEAEMRHLVSLTYPDYIRNILLKKVAADVGLPDYAVV